MHSARFRTAHYQRGYRIAHASLWLCAVHLSLWLPHSSCEVPLLHSPPTQFVHVLRAHARGSSPTSMPTTTGTSGFARILRIWPLLPLAPPSSNLSRTKCGGLLPPIHHWLSSLSLLLLSTG